MAKFTTDLDCIKQRKYFGIPAWHAAGHTGKGTEVLPIAVYMRDKIKQYNLIVTGSADNSNGKPTDQSFNGACMAVSSVILNGGKPKTGNDCVGPNIDFTMFTGLQAGTSFASPFLLGMAGQLRSKNPDITQDEVYDYFKTTLARS